MKDSRAVTVAVASTSEIKLEAARYGIQQLFPNFKITVIPYNAPSGVSKAPTGWGETETGAKNRMKALLASGIIADWYVSIENGVQRVNGHLMDAAFVIVVNNTRTEKRYATSSGIPLPLEIVLETVDIESDKREDWGTLLAQINPSNSKDPHSFLTGHQVPRVAHLTLAVKTAASQFFA